MEQTTPSWIRIGLVALLGIPNVMIGAWATLDPAGWFADFPGIGPSLVAGSPPYNEHLASDVGAAFLATGACVLIAAYWGTRKVVQLSLLTFLVFTTPHTVYHALHPADALSGAADLVNVLVLGTGVLWALGLLWAASSDRFDAPSPLTTAVDPMSTARPQEVHT